MRRIEKQTLDIVAPESPYRGIHPFRFADQEYYFGRKELTAEIVDKILLYRLLVIFGESGAGKSSLLNAGLMPVLKNKGYQPERLRVRPFRDQPILVEEIEVEGNRVLPSIFASRDAEHSNGSALTSSLQHFHKSIDHAVKNKYPVLVFDQFEELFTLFSQERILQLRLLNTISRLANDARLKVKVVLTIREDFLGQLQILTKKYPQVIDHRVRIGLLTKENAKQAILDPFKSPNPFASTLTPELAAHIVEQLAATQADRTIPPTQLQIICSRLWNKYAAGTTEIGIDQFKEMGEVKGILKEYLTSELQSLETSRRRPAVEIMTKLITNSNTRDVVSKEKIEKLSSNGRQDGEITTILGSLETHRLINQVSQRGTYYFELSSEFLIEPVQKELARLRREQQRRNTRIVFCTLLVLFIAAAIAGVYWYKTQRETQTELNNAKKQVVLQSTEVSDRYTKLFENLKKLESENKDVRAEAKSGILAQAEQAEIPEAWVPLIQSILSKRASANEANQYGEELTQTIKATPAPSPQVVAADLPIRIYMQISNREQRDKANQIKNQLEKEGMVVPSISLVKSSSDSDVLKFFQEAERDSGNVAKITALLKSLGMNVQAAYIKGYENSTVIRPKHYELWFAGPRPDPSTVRWFVRYRLPSGEFHEVVAKFDCVEEVAGELQVSLTNDGTSRFGPFETQGAAETFRQLVQSRCPGVRAVLNEETRAESSPTP